MKPLLERLKEKNRPLLADGAMGTLLHARGIPMDDCFERCNLTRPALISEVHAAYIKAGADMIETNTFGANRLKLTEFGLEDQVAEINRKGVELALAAVKASGRDVYVAASVGPLGIGVQPYGRIKQEDARAVFAEQIGALAQAGANAILFETFTDLTEALLALEAAREIAPGVPVICEMTFGHEDCTLTGHLPGNVARKLHEAGADVIGVNCSAGPGHITRILQLMKQAAPDAIFSAMPNAGFPETVGGRTMYPATVEYFAEYALTAKAIGATIIGGCCGTTPDHIAAMRAALDDHSRPLPHVTSVEPHSDEEHIAAESPSELAFKLANGQFIVSVEMKPPRSHNFDRIFEAAQMLTESGADVLNIADSPAAQMRVSPWAVANLLQNRLGAETVLHFPTRGRNLLRVQGDLLGAHALGLRNIFVCMGDPTRIGDYPDANDTYDIVPSGLIKLISQRMNHGVDQAGNSIGQPTSFTVGCALNMGADDPIKEIEVLRKKIEAGANFALAQATFEPHIAENFLKRYEEVEGHPLELPVLIGVMPLYSLKHARFLDNEIPGINIPPAIFKRIEDAGDNAAAEGVRVAQELLRDMRDLVRGVYIIPAFGRYELAAQVIEAVTVA